MTSDNDYKESSQEPRPPKRLSWLEMFAALKLLQNCSPFEEQQAAFQLQNHLDKFSVLYEKTLQSKKQQTKIDTFFTQL